MSYTQDNLRAALASAQPTRQAVAQTSNQHVRSQVAPSSAVDEPSSPPPVNVSFSIEKKVGDVRIHAYGHAGQEESAREAVNETAAKFRK